MFVSNLNVEIRTDTAPYPLSPVCDEADDDDNSNIYHIYQILF